MVQAHAGLLKLMKLKLLQTSLTVIATMCLKEPKAQRFNASLARITKNNKEK
jgi:hypothetical protein